MKIYIYTHSCRDANPGGDDGGDDVMVGDDGVVMGYHLLICVATLTPTPPPPDRYEGARSPCVTESQSLFGIDEARIP